MPKLGCPCGYVHNLSPIPDDGWVTVRDRDYEKLVAAENEMHDIVDGEPLKPKIAAIEEYEKAEAVVAKVTGVLYECPDYHRVMWDKPGEDSFVVYTRET